MSAPEAFENAAPSFRDVIADAVGEHDEHMVWEPNFNRALSVLDMPEMQMIRLVLDRGGEDWMRGQGLPECVIAWVLEPS